MSPVWFYCNIGAKGAKKSSVQYMMWFLLQVPVGHPSEIDEIFDDISYSKGASVIRMLHKYIGDEVND